MLAIDKGGKLGLKKKHDDKCGMHAEDHNKEHDNEIGRWDSNIFHGTFK